MTDTGIIQQLMDEAYDKWQDNGWSKEDFRNYISKNMSREHLIAVQIGNLNYQVENGGFLQWYDNGYYSMDLEDLITYCEEIKTKAATEVKVLLESVRDIIDFYSSSTEAIELLNEHMFSEHAEILDSCLWDLISAHLDQHNRQYYGINDEFLSDVETYLNGSERR